MKKLKLGKGDWICIVIFLIVIDLLCLWCVDISVSALLNGGTLTNGFRMNGPMQMYHLGLYGSILSTVMLSFICVHKILEEKRENDKDGIHN